MIDPVTALRTWYQAQPSLTALLVADADHGIYRSPPGVPKSLADQNTAPKCVILQAVGGTSNPAAPRITTRLYVRCYAPAGPAAMEIFRRIWDLHYRPEGRPIPPTVIASRWLLLSSDLAQPLSTVEETGWPVVAASLIVRFDAILGETPPP